MPVSRRSWVVLCAIGAFLSSSPALGQALISVQPDQGVANGEMMQVVIESNESAYFYDEGIREIRFLPAGSDVTINSHDVLGPQRLWAQITIAVDAPRGLQRVEVETLIDTYSGEDLFEIIDGGGGEPRIVQVSPSSATAGESLSVTVTGGDTNFDGTSILSFSPAGIQVGTPTVTDSSTLQASIDIAPGATAGPRNVTVTTGAEVATGTGLFTVEAPALIVSPASGMQGETLAAVTISGGPGGYSGQTVIDMGEGITIGGSGSPDGQVLNLTNVVIAADTQVGPRDVVLSNPAVRAPGAFRVEQGAQTLLLSVTPDHGDRGHPALVVQFVGQNTHFDDDDVTVLFSTGGIRVDTLSAADATHLEAELVIGDTALEGPADVTVALGRQSGCTTCEEVSLPAGFEITAPGSLDSATPAVLRSGENVSVTLAATDGQFVQGTTVLLFEPPDGIEVTALSVSGPDLLVADLALDADASGVARDARAVTGTEVAVGFGVVDVYHPEIVRLSPSSAFPGSNNLPVVVEGRDIPFDGATQVSFAPGDGITLHGVSFDPASPDEVTLDISVAQTAPTGTHDVTVLAGGIEVTGSAAFQVINLKPPDEGGCSCGRPAAASGWWIAGLAGLLWMAIRRRSTPRPSP